MCRSDLESAVRAGILSAEQADRLVAHLAGVPDERPQFSFVHVVYYLGGMIAIGAVLVRRVFAVFGALGVAMYLGDLSWRVFQDSWIFPLALSGLGLAIIGLGIVWQRHERQWSASLRGRLPAPLRELIEARAIR